jgi:hypothetical protein
MRMSYVGDLYRYSCRDVARCVSTIKRVQMGIAIQNNDEIYLRIVWQILFSRSYMGLGVALVRLWYGEGREKV